LKSRFKTSGKNEGEGNVNRNMSGRRGWLGFTIIELMIVIAIISILLGIAAPMYIKSIQSAKEAALRQNLYTIRNAIDQYTLDKQKAPQSLDDLVQGGYLKAIPKDPITNATDTWKTEIEDSMMSVDQTQPGISDVHSGSDQTGTDGTVYSTW
jgi:general secretion pathway protein G